MLDSSLLTLINNSSTISKKYQMLKSIDIFLNRCIKSLDKKDKKRVFLEKIKTSKADSFADALQRILFENMLFWQELHTLIGIGHLDAMLYDYYRNDINSGKITQDSAFHMIKEFLSCLHKYYLFKSAELPGDTGQIIILGGLLKNGNYLSNDLTILFIRAVKELQLPDPKILLRTSKEMPLNIMKEAVHCIQTGIGCPLFANDDVILPSLEKFGYKKDDVFNYGTAACWEPLIIGKTSDLNNIAIVNFADPFADNSIYNTNFAFFDDFLNYYIKNLLQSIDKIIVNLHQLHWDKTPLLSLFVHNCNETDTDITENTAVYHNYGFLSVGLANTVNSLLNIKKFVYDKKIITFQLLGTAISNNYEGYENIQTLLKENDSQYGLDNKESIEMADHLFMTVSDYIEEINNKEVFSHKIKIGLSSPSYLSSGKKFAATPDGRNYGTPFSVHISNDRSTDFTQLFKFASCMNYKGNRFNGNVVDFMVAPSFIENNFEKFTQMLFDALNAGVFEMQMNVISSKTLVRAKEHPEEFPQLIVRVWGFSAYFNDLPEEYKNLLINRAQENECNRH